MHAPFAFLIKLSLSQPLSFLTFTLLILSPSHEAGVGEWMDGTELLAGVKSQQEPMDRAVSTLGSWLVMNFSSLSKLSVGDD